MTAIILYESMFGNTRLIAEAVASGLQRFCPVSVERCSTFDVATVSSAELLVIGGPTHAWSMSRPRTRRGVSKYIQSRRDLKLEPGADTEPGVRELLEVLPIRDMAAAAFDTRIRGSALLTGRASKAIGRALKDHKMRLVQPPMSFLVDKGSHLLDGETRRAEEWGEDLGRLVFSGQPVDWPSA